jgi:hypothetical protein
MRTSIDAIRSLARYMTLAFGEDFEVGYFAEEGTFARPGISVVAAGPELAGGGTRHTVDIIQPFALYAYPSPGESVEEGFFNAMGAQEKFFQAFRVGIEEGRPMRVPLYDYEGVALNEGTILRRYPDFLRILDLSVERKQAPEDERLWTVICEIRAGWRRTAELPTGTRLAQSVKADFELP